jgi:hypothetical protein
MLSGVEGVRACVGFHLGYSNWLEVDRTMLPCFESLTGEQSWAEIGTSTESSVPSVLLLALTIPMLHEIYVLEDAPDMTLHGIERVSFLSPAPFNSGLRVAATIKAVQPLDGHWQLILTCQMECDVKSEPVLQADVIYRFRSASVKATPMLSMYRSG